MSILYGIGRAGMYLEKAGGEAAKKFLKTLYKGKIKTGKQVEKAAKFAGKKGYTKTSKFTSGTRKKAHQGSRLFGQAIKENPKIASFGAGAYTYKFLNDDE